MVVTIVFVGRFRRRLDELLRKERQLLSDAEAKQRELAGALASVERAQEAVRFQARLLDAVGQAVIATDVTGASSTGTDRRRDLFGYRRSSRRGGCITDIMPDPPAAREDTLSRLRRGDFWVGRDGSRRPDGTASP